MKPVTYRLDWSPNLTGWYLAWRKLSDRRPTSNRYKQLDEHLSLLTEDVVMSPDTQFWTAWRLHRCGIWEPNYYLSHEQSTWIKNKVKRFMSQTYMTDAFKALFEAIKERAAKHGEQVKVNFVKNCLKRVNPKVMTIMNIANDTEWKFLPKPDDAPERGDSGEAEFIATTKDRYYKQWLERVNKGEFDGKKRPDMHIGEDAPEDEPEEVDMAALARAEKEKAEKIAEAEKTPVAIVNEPKEEEDNGDFDETHEEAMKHEQRLEEGGIAKVESHAHSEMRLLDALSDFVTRTAVANDSPPEDTPAPEVDLTEVNARLDKLEKKVASLFNAMRDL